MAFGYLPGAEHGGALPGFGGHSVQGRADPGGEFEFKQKVWARGVLFVPVHEGVVAEAEVAAVVADFSSFLMAVFGLHGRIPIQDDAIG